MPPILETISLTTLSQEYAPIINKFLDNNPDLDIKDRAFIFTRLLTWIEDIYLKIENPSATYIAMGITQHGTRWVREYLAELEEEEGKRMRSGVAIKRRSDLTKELIDMALDMDRKTA